MLVRGRPHRCGGSGCGACPGTSPPDWRRSSRSPAAEPLSAPTPPCQDTPRTRSPQTLEGEAGVTGKNKHRHAFVTPSAGAFTMPYIRNEPCCFLTRCIRFLSRCKMTVNLRLLRWARRLECRLCEAVGEAVGGGNGRRQWGEAVGEAE